MKDARNALPRLIALSDCRGYPHCPEALSALCSEAAAGSVAIVIRDREQTVLDKLAWARPLLATARQFGQRVIVADRWDLARVLGADGVHLGGSAVLPSRLRGQVSWLSRTGHGLEDLADAELRQLDAALLSPAFAERKGRAAVGASALAARVFDLHKRAPSLACYALGGVSAENASQALAAGMHGVAVIGAVMEGSVRAALLAALRIESRA